MASVTASATNEDGDLALTWSGRWSLVHRIIAVNVLTLVLVALSIFFLDRYRYRLEKERVHKVETVADMSAIALATTPPDRREQMLGGFSKKDQNRIRVYAPDGSLQLDSWRASGPTYELRDPETQRWTKDVARALDKGFNALVGADTPDLFTEPTVDRASAWPEVVRASKSNQTESEIRLAPELTPVFSAATRAADGSVVLVTDNDREFTKRVRKQRGALALAMLGITTLSILLSLFLARTIVRPLRRIALAAHRVRQGRAREVVVPRLPSRQDEIGLLARSVSDMSQSLRHRIDNIEAFAADVTHELKNPLASLRSAVDSLDKVNEPELCGKLVDVIRQDVFRLDRLINDVGEAARTDAELARARLEAIDLGELVGGLVEKWEVARTKGDVQIAYARPRKGSTMVLAEPSRLARAIDNIIDNAISFSPPGGLVEIAVTRVADDVRIRIDDEGPGVPPEQREAIFNRFHSIRPMSEDFGRHSGLGLAIARAIVEGHDGTIDVADRDDAPSGARFTIIMKAAGLT